MIVCLYDILCMYVCMCVCIYVYICIYVLCINFIPSLTGILYVPTYNGAVTDVTCSTTAPAFLVNDIYSSFQYPLLPELYDIDAKVAPDKSYVTLCINGTSLANNVTVECRNITDHINGLAVTLFRFTLQYVGESQWHYS